MKTIAKIQFVLFMGLSVLPITYSLRVRSKTEGGEAGEEQYPYLVYGLRLSVNRSSIVGDHPRSQL